MTSLSPPRGLPLAVGLTLLALGLAFIGISLTKLADATLTPALVIWVGLPLLGGALSIWAGYQVYGVASAEYQLDREAFRLRWGLAYELVPFGQIDEISRPAAGERIQPPGGLRLPGSHVGLGQVDDERVEFFATDLDQLLLARCSEATFAISPANPEAFLEDFLRFSRMGSVERPGRRSERPQLLPVLIWSDQWARGLLLAGLAVPFALLSYLVLTASSLPPEVPFGFLPSGEPGPAVPTGRLLLLPLVAGLVWLLDLLLGGWLYRRGADRPLSYALWSMSIVVGCLLWGAAAYMVSAAA
ncbi:MAG: PH domain-containing protein [Anaerolineales bacterium]|nr:PH domain-containing protein [Anaerolineales bacterium]